MPSTATDRLTGLTTSVAVKAPCVATSAANITLSGLQTIDGVALAEDDRVLVKGQTDTTENGVYNASSGTWARTADCDGALDMRNGTLVYVTGGSTYSGVYKAVAATADITPGTTAVTFTLVSVENILDLLASTAAADVGPGLVAFNVAMSYAAFTVGSAIQDLGVSALWYMTAAQRTSVLAGDLVEDVTTPVQAAITAAYGRSLYMPGRYKITSGLTVTGRVKIYGDHSVSSELVYRTASTSDNALLDFDNVDNIHVEDLALTNSNSSGGQNTTAIRCQGDLGSVTEIKLRNVYIDGFMKYGVKFHSGALYITLDGVRIMNCTNDVAAGGTGVGNAVALYFGTTVNAITITRSRVSANDEAVNGDTTAKYCLSVRDSSFEVNGETGTPGSTVTLYNWHGVTWSGNYCEANKTGAAVDASFLRLQACAAVRIEGGLINGSSGGVGKSKNLIGISDNCVGVVVEGIELQDPITKLVYALDGNSIVSLRRNSYYYGGVELTTYAAIMARMSSPLVELDVAKLEAVNTGVVGAAGNYQVDVTMDGIDVTREASVMATMLNGGAGFTLTGAATATDKVKLTFFNVNGVNNTFNGTVAVRVLKAGR